MEWDKYLADEPKQTEDNWDKYLQPNKKEEKKKNKRVFPKEVLDNQPTDEDLKLTTGEKIAKFLGPAVAQTAQFGAAIPAVSGKAYDIAGLLADVVSKKAGNYLRGLGTQGKQISENISNQAGEFADTPTQNFVQKLGKGAMEMALELPAYQALGLPAMSGLSSAAETRARGGNLGETALSGLTGAATGKLQGEIFGALGKLPGQVLPRATAAGVMGGTTALTGGTPEQIAEQAILAAGMTGKGTGEVNPFEKYLAPKEQMGAAKEKFAEVPTESKLAWPRETKEKQPVEVFPGANKLKEEYGLEKQDALKKDIEKNGLKEPIQILVDPNGREVIYDGEHRYISAKELGMEIPSDKIQKIKVDDVGKYLPDESRWVDFVNERESTAKDKGLSLEEGNRTKAIELEKVGDTWNPVTTFTGEGDVGVGRIAKDGKRKSERITVQRNPQTGVLEDSVSKAKITDTKILEAVKVAETGGVDVPVPEYSISETSPKQKPNETLLGDLVPGMKERQTVTNSLTKVLGDEVDNYVGKEKFYKPDTNERQINDAGDRIKAQGIQKRVSELLTKPSFSVDDVVEAGIALDTMKKNGDYGGAVILSKKVATQGTKKGSELQAFTTYDLLSSPEVVAQKIINEARKKLPKKLIEQLKDITPEQIKRWTEMAGKIDQLPDSAQRDTQTELLFKDIQDMIPVTGLKKIGTVQTIHQLLNAKTIIRNILGNVGLNGMEVVSHYIGIPVDRMLSRITGNRTVTVPKIKSYLSNMVEGFRLGNEDVRLGINTAKRSIERRTGVKIEGKFENMIEFASGGTFKAGQAKKFKVLNDFYSKLEKAVGYTMQSTDRAFYEARFWDSLDNMMAATKTKTMEKPLVEQALKEAAKVTFRDMNNISRALVNIKRGLNQFTGGREWGLGDLALKYPRVPGAIIKRGIEYSPFGFIESAFNFKKSMSNKGDVAAQREAVLSSARATLGTVLALTGYALAKSGVLTGKQNENKKVADFENAIGKRPYSFQALNRLFSYDWFQPAAIPFTMGVDLATKKALEEKGNGVLSQLANHVAGTIQSAGSTIAEQPVMTGVSRLFGGGQAGISSGITSGLQAMAESAPSTFIPTVASQVSATIDPYKRQIPVDFAGRLLGLMANKMPGLSKLLERRKGVLGEDLMRGTGNKIIDAIFNLASPAIISEIRETPETKFVYDLFKQTGETEALPRRSSKTITYKNKTYELTPEQVSKLQEIASKSALQKIRSIGSGGYLNKLNKENQIKIIGRIYDWAGNKAREEMLRTIRGK